MKKQMERFIKHPELNDNAEADFPAFLRFTLKLCVKGHVCGLEGNLCFFLGII